MRTTLVLVAITGMACTAGAQTTASSIASLTGTIQPGGPRQGANGLRFMNIEGLNNGSFASYGVARWDLAAVKAGFDTAYGAGHWHVTKVELELTQDNAAFSLAGPASVYFTTDDSTDIQTLTSPLFYPFFDPGSNLPDMPLGNGGAAILQYGFNVVSSGTVDRYTQTGSLENGVPLSATEVLSLAPDLVQHITTSNALSLVFVEGSSATAATYHGQTPDTVNVPPRNGPNIFITAEPTGSVCYPNCDASTGTPILNANDFQCFLNKFAASDSYANCDGSTATPILNANDFQCFLNLFAAGCQ